MLCFAILVFEERFFDSGYLPRPPAMLPTRYECLSTPLVVTVPKKGAASQPPETTDRVGGEPVESSWISMFSHAKGSTSKVGRSEHRTALVYFLLSTSFSQRPRVALDSN